MTAADTIKDIHVEVKRCPDCGARFGVDAAFCPFDGVPLASGSWDPTADPLKGKVIDGRYEVVGPLGEGGMGTVYKVRHVTLNRFFAMKVLRRDLATDADLAARFVQEARATAAIKHASVVAINDFGELDDGLPYFVMELLSGETLAVRMRARGPLPPREAIKIARRVADGLEASHKASVIHRDLKPENIFLVGKAAGKPAEDEVRIVDFGAAKIVGASKLTRPGVVFGTPYYMSPEQASGQSVDARADVYSLGVLLYEMLTGRVPFEADTYMGVLTKHMFATPLRPSETVATGVQLFELETVVMRALEKDPNARYPSMSAVAQALDDAEKARPSGRPAGMRLVTPNKTIPIKQPSTADRIEWSVERIDREQRRGRSKNLVLGVVAACCVIMVGAGVVSVITADQRPAGRPSAKAELPPRPSPTPAAVVSSPPQAATNTTAPGAGVPPPEPAPDTPPPQAKPRVVAPVPVAKTPVAAPKPPSPSPPPPRKKGDDFPDPWEKR